MKMQSLIKRLVKENLRKVQGEIVFASLFGSYRRGDCDAFSDIDIFVVYEDDDEKPVVSDSLKGLERTFNRKIHINLFNLREFERRLRFHDYLTASIIEDSSFIMGRKDIFAEAKRRILEKRPYEESIRFNRQMGFKTIEHICSYLDDLSLSASCDYEDLLSRVVKSLNDYRLALGYLYASRLMQSCKGGISSMRLAKTEIGSTLKEIAWMEKILKRRAKIDCKILRKLAEDIKTRSLQISSLNQDSIMKLDSLSLNPIMLNPLSRLIKDD